MEQKVIRTAGLILLTILFVSPLLGAEDAGSPVMMIAALDAGPVLKPTTVVNDAAPVLLDPEPEAVKAESASIMKKNELPPLIINKAPIKPEPNKSVSAKPDAIPSGPDNMDLEKAKKALPALEETKDLEALQKSIESMKKDLDKMKNDLAKKQNSPDPNKKFTCKPGGQMFLTGVDISQNDRSKNLYDDIQNVYGFQDLRLNVSGNGYGGIRYKFEMAFQNSNIAFKDVDITVPDVPVWGDLRMGHFYVESGMGLLEPAFDTTFTDRTSVTNAFRADRHFGVGSIHYFDNKNIRWFSGIFEGKTLDTAKGAYGYNDTSDLILNTRLSAVPVYRECNGQLCEVLHFGTSYYWCDPDYEQDANYKLQARPTGWLFDQPRVLNGKLPVETMDSYSVAQVEAAWQYGRFGVHSEYFYGNYKNYGESQGAYLLGRLMLNEGAYRKYNKDRGVFGSVNVPQNLRIVDYDNGLRCFDGFGVFELATMVGWTDMNNLENVPNSTYGNFYEILNGINWYWNEQTRFALFWNHTIADSAKYGTSPEEDSIMDSIVFQFRIKF